MAYQVLLSLQISVVPECMKESCLSNIDLNANAYIQPGNKDTFITGESEKILVIVNIENVTEIKTTRDLTIRMSNSDPVSFIKCVNSFNFETLSCYVTSDNGNKIRCSVDIASLTEQLNNFSAVFEFYLLDDSPSVEFDVGVFNGKRVSNNVTITVPVVSVSNISVIG